MSFYEELGITPLINASETYTNLGGSLMDPRTLQAMNEAASGFMDLGELLTKVCEKAAKLTHNDAAFVTSGAAGGVILSAAACLCGENTDKLDALPNTEQLEKNEIVIFNGELRSIIPYWHLTALTGAKIIDAPPSVEGLMSVISERTAAVFLFPAPLYERGLPVCEEVIPKLKEKGITVVVDAAAQLPPASNLWYYTKTLGADLTVFSGGKHIKGPQSTGLIVGREDLIRACRLAASPNARIGRAFKTGKEELAGFITALEIFCTEDEKARYDRQEKLLIELEKQIVSKVPMKTTFMKEGRLGTYQPLLLVDLPEGMTAENCNKYTRALAQPIDIGVYPPEFRMPENRVFLNAYNLKEEHIPVIAKAITDYVMLQNEKG